MDVKHIIPAQPGFFLLYPVTDENNDIGDVAKEHVIAWAVDDIGAIYPVTPSEIVDHGNPFILTPSGTVDSYGEQWDDLDGWLVDQKKCAAATKFARARAEALADDLV